MPGWIFLNNKIESVVSEHAGTSEKITYYTARHPRSKISGRDVFWHEDSVRLTNAVLSTTVF